MKIFYFVPSSHVHITLYGKYYIAYYNLTDIQATLMATKIRADIIRKEVESTNIFHIGFSNIKGC